jgi:hypothetical protein
MVLGFAVAIAGFVQSNQGNTDSHGGSPARRAVIYVMPSALASPGQGDTSPVVVDSSHNGKEPQVAKVYQELQHNKNCQSFSENMVKDKADYFLLLQHGGGVGNRWAVSNKSGDVVASGQAFTVGKSVTDACAAIARDWNSTAAASH